MPLILGAFTILDTRLCTLVSKLKTQAMEACILAPRPRLHGTPITLENVHPMQLHCSHQKREKLLCIAIGRCLNLRQRPCYVVAYEICALLACLGQLLSQPALAIIKQPVYHKSRMRRENIVPIPQSMAVFGSKCCWHTLKLCKISGRVHRRALIVHRCYVPILTETFAGDQSRFENLTPP